MDQRQQQPYTNNINIVYKFTNLANPPAIEITTGELAYISKCRSFLIGQLEYCTHQPAVVGQRIHRLLQKVVDGYIHPKNFCNLLASFVYSALPADLEDILVYGLPGVRKILFSRELIINGIRPPPHTAIISTAIAGHETAHVGKDQLPKGSLDKRAAKSKGPAKHPGEEDELNGVPLIGGISLERESKLLVKDVGNSGMQARSCKDRVLLNKTVLRNFIRAMAIERGLAVPSDDVAIIISHACEEHLKNVIDKLVAIAKPRCINPQNAQRCEEPAPKGAGESTDRSLLRNAAATATSTPTNGDVAPDATPCKPPINKITLGDAIFLMEQDPQMNRSEVLYKTYLK